MSTKCRPEGLCLSLTIYFSFDCKCCLVVGTWYVIFWTSQQFYIFIHLDYNFYNFHFSLWSKKKSEFFKSLQKYNIWHMGRLRITFFNIMFQYRNSENYEWLLLWYIEWDILQYIWTVCKTVRKSMYKKCINRITSKFQWNHIELWFHFIHVVIS